MSVVVRRDKSLQGMRCLARDRTMVLCLDVDILRLGAMVVIVVICAEVDSCRVVARCQILHLEKILVGV